MTIDPDIPWDDVDVPDEAAGGELVPQFRHGAWVLGLEYSPNGRYIVTSGGTAPDHPRI